MIKFLQDDSGNNSSMRLAMLVVVAAIMAGWLYVVLITKSLIILADPRMTTAPEHRAVR